MLDLLRASERPLGRHGQREARRQRHRLLRPREDEVQSPFVRLHRRPGQRRDRIDGDQHVVELVHDGGEFLQRIEDAGRTLRVDDGDEVVAAGSRGKRVAQPLRQVRLTPLRLERVRGAPRRFGDRVEPLAERPVRETEDAAAREVRDRRFHHAGGGRGREIHGPRRPEESRRKRLHRLDQARDLGAPVPDDGSPHGIEQIRRDFGRAGQKEAAERYWRVHGGRWYRPRPPVANCLLAVLPRSG